MPFSSERNSPVGVHQRHPHPPRAESGSDEVGRPAGRSLQIPEVGGRGSAVGSEEEEQQHDVREAQQSHEVNTRLLNISRPSSRRLYDIRRLREALKISKISCRCNVRSFPLKDWSKRVLFFDRYYYKRDILERVDGRRLVYKFGKNSTGWRIEEMGYWRRPEERGSPPHVETLNSINEERQILSLETNSFQKESFRWNCKPVLWLE